MEAHVTDSPLHIASILIISNDDWDILAPHSGLFDSSNRIKKELWGRKLQMDIGFRDFDTTRTKGDQDLCLWFPFINLPRTVSKRSTTERF